MGRWDLYKRLTGQTFKGHFMSDFDSTISDHGEGIGNIRGTRCNLLDCPLELSTSDDEKFCVAWGLGCQINKRKGTRVQLVI